MKKNLLEETMDHMREAGKGPTDVQWVGTDQASCSWDQFAAAAAELIYDDGFGTQEICESLVVFSDGSWMERGEYDGSEWWELKRTPEPKPYGSIADHLRSY